MKENKNLKLRLFFLYIGSFIASCAPLALTLIINRKDYFTEPQSSVKLGVGAIIIFVLIFLKVIGKLKVPSRITAFGAVFVLSYLLSSLLEDITLLSGMALLGEFVDLVVFQRPIKTLRENILVGKTADATATQIEDVFKKYIGSGRT